MRVAVPKEIMTGERRVAVVPDAAARLVESGFELQVELGAGAAAFFPDSAYQEAGATIVNDSRALFSGADVLLKVRKPVLSEEAGTHEVEMMREGGVLVGLLEPLASPDLVRILLERRVTSFSLEAIPRISRAQKMDALSSQSTVAGYKAVLVAASSLPRFFPMLMTAAGTIAPAKVLVVGAGVAGLQAIATSRRLGAVVEAFDIRPAVKEEVESLGAKFVELELEEEELEDAGGYAKEISQESQRRERELIHEHVKRADIVITTALIPGKQAPVLVTEEMVRDMRPGSVIVDLAAEAGGNCELTEADAEVVRHGIIIHGPLNLPSSMATHASQMYSRNISSLLEHLVEDGELNLDFEDEITRGSCITHEGHIVNERVRELVG